MNIVNLFGNLGQDPEIKYSQSGNAVANLSLATNERVKEGEEWVDRPEWHRLVVFGKRAEVIGKYCQKGSKLAVTGRLQTRKWQDKNGQDRYTTEIVVNDFDFGGQTGGAPVDNRSNEGGFRDKPVQDDFQDDDIPF